MAGTFKTSTKDKGYKAILETFKEVATKPSVKIGVLESSGSHKESEGLTVADIATFHEFGTESIPERSFIRSTVDQKFNIYLEKSKQLQAKVILQALSVGKALSVLGELIQSDIIKTINSGIEPELSEATKKSKVVNGKSGNTPLVDSGQLKQSIRYQVEGV